MKKTTNDKYIQIFALYKQGIPYYVIADKLNCSDRTIHQAIKWCIDNAPQFTSADYIKIQLEKIRELKLEARQRLQKLRDGTTEKTVKKHYGQEIESIEHQRYNFNAEVGLLRLLKELTIEENTLLNVYNACTHPESNSLFGDLGASF